MKNITENKRVNENKDGKVEEKKEKSDYLVDCMGEFGYWQARVCIISVLIRLLVHWNTLSMLLLFPKAQFKCVKFSDNTIEDVQNSTCYDNCEEYDYETILFDNDIRSKFGLVCDRAWLANFTQTLLMFGFVCGVSVFGWFSDRFGRQFAFRACTTLAVLSMITAPFSNNYTTFAIMRYFSGFGAGGIMSVGIVLIVEISSPKYRDIVGALLLLADNLAMASLAFANFLTSWELFLEGYALFGLLFSTSLIFVPETPRWLISNGRTEDAFKLIKSVVEYNKTSICDDIIRTNIEKIFVDISESKNDKTNKNYTDLFRIKFIKLTLSCFLVWSLNAFCFFGVSQYTTYIGGSKDSVYLAVLINGLMQIPFLPIGILSNRFGRKLSLIIPSVVLFIAMVVLTILSKDNVLYYTVISGIGLGVADIGFLTLYVFTSELFPTSLRGTAFGITGAGAKIAAMISPYIATLEPVWLPSTIFAICPIIIISLVLLLPETKGKNLDGVE